VERRGASVVVAILTRGSREAKAWLWSVLARDEVRKLVRHYRGASALSRIGRGCARSNPIARRVKQLAVTPVWPR